MQSFIKDVVKDVLGTEQGIEDVIFVLPSKRAGVFLQQEIGKSINQTVLAPEIYSVEDFIGHISGLVTANTTTQLFELYKAYLAIGDYEKESFDSFLKWGQILLQDFNEIDRYLVDANTLYQNVAAIQEVNHWSLHAEKSEMIENYLHFWRHLKDIYKEFNANLLQQGLGHQGLIYKTSVEKLPDYLNDVTKKHIFLGFNALNKAESNLIQSILQKTTATIYWDIDGSFLKDEIHDAGYFIRAYQNTWSALKNKPLKGISNYYLTKKEINVIGVPKNISQVNYVGHLLQTIHRDSPEQLKNAAIVLGNEELLNPLLNFIPEDITATNITMGQKLELTTLASFFLHLLEFHEQKTEKGWFYKHLLNLLTHSYTVMLFNEMGLSTRQLITTIKTNNWSYISMSKISSLLGEHKTIALLFKDVKDNPNLVIDHFLELVQELRQIDSVSKDAFILEQLYKFYTLFNQLKDLCHSFTYINSLKSLKQLYKQLLSTETLDFQGNPVEGIQIMGMLESRLLDFETVILTSVNEGILPSGKSNNSFIPFDLKTKNDLPTYKEKDAVYTYHFYRLLQRAKNVYILYNTEPDALEGGEKSRLITQLLTDEYRTDVKEFIATPQIQSYPITQDVIPKTESLVALIKKKAAKGFSPSSLSNYIRNPIDFYKQNLLNINDILEVEETLAPNTFGTIVHDSLEALYTPLIDTYLTKEGLIAVKKDIQKTVLHNFQKTFKEGNIQSGKNYITFHVILKYIQTFIDIEIEQLAHHTIKIIGLEQDLRVPLEIEELDFPITLRGKLDRIDEFDGVTRIIDYKTGRVDRRNVELMDWEVLTQDYQYSKAFQLLCYGLMYFKTNPNANLTVQAGIISLKNFTDGTLLFAQKESARGPKNHSINTKVIQDFEQILSQLIKEICNPQIPFTEKEI